MLRFNFVLAIDKRFYIEKLFRYLFLQEQRRNKAGHIKVTVSRDFMHFFSSLIQPIWAPDSQFKMVSLKN